MKKFFLTTPIYYVNDSPHIGHAYTTIACDIISRYKKLIGKNVFFLTGTDEHGLKIDKKSKQEGYKNPKEFCDFISLKFKKTWKLLDVNYDFFIRTTDKMHKKIVQRFLIDLKERGYIYKAKYKGYYCTGCEDFLTEKQLKSGKCLIHKKKPDMIKEENYFFNLKKFLPEIKKKILNDEIKIRPIQRRNEVLGLLEQNLDNFSISRDKKRVSWGIEVPWDNTQTIYVWIDALLNYYSAPKISGESEIWPPDLHLIGKDILKFHTIYWPALLLANHQELPNTIFIHGYFSIKGEKMSKTLGNVISPYDLVERYGKDATRYLLFSVFPFGNDGDISFEVFDNIYLSDLVNGYGNLVMRILGLSNMLIINKWNQDKRFKTLINLIKKRIDKHYQELNLYEIILELRRFTKFLDSVIEKEKPFKFNKKSSKFKNLIGNLLESIRIMNILISPIMPKIADKVKNNIGNLSNELRYSVKEFKIKKEDVLFKKLD